VVLLSDDGVRVGFAQGTVEPAVEVVAESAGAQDAEAVFLPEMINLDDGGRHSGERGARSGERGARS